MALLKVLKYGDPRLQEVAEPVASWTTDLDSIVADMLETMYYTRGVGLAATQVGIIKQLFVADISGGKDPNQVLVITNPSIIEQSGDSCEEEGCLSIPGIYAKVKRPYKIVLRGRTIRGEGSQWPAEGFLARAFCHEVDHLNGTLFIDRLSIVVRDMVLRKIAKKKRAGDWD